MGNRKCESLQSTETTNQSEGFNTVLTQCQCWKEVPIHLLVYARLQKYCYNEIQRGYCGLGSYVSFEISMGIRWTVTTASFYSLRNIANIYKRCTVTSLTMILLYPVTIKQIAQRFWPQIHVRYAEPSKWICSFSVNTQILTQILIILLSGQS